MRTTRRLRLSVAIVLAAGAAAAQPIAVAAPVDPPPAAGTMEERADRRAVAAPVAAERQAQAEADQLLDPFIAFGDVLGPGFAAAALPATAELLFTTMIAVLAPVEEAKTAYPRERPFVADPALFRCGTEAELLTPTRSYPSGHAAIGYGWGLVLADLLPAAAAAILGRAAEYGESRVVCGVHWPSDVAAGQAIAAMTLRLLHEDADFVAQLAAARRETAELR